MKSIQVLFIKKKRQNTRYTEYKKVSKDKILDTFKKCHKIQILKYIYYLGTITYIIFVSMIQPQSMGIYYIPTVQL